MNTSIYPLQHIYTKSIAKLRTRFIHLPIYHLSLNLPSLSHIHPLPFLFPSFSLPPLSTCTLHTYTTLEHHASPLPTTRNLNPSVPHFPHMSLSINGALCGRVCGTWGRTREGREGKFGGGGNQGTLSGAGLGCVGKKVGWRGNWRGE